MMTQELRRGELSKAVIKAAERQPHTKVAKLIKYVESEASQKNIILLLIQIAEHPDLSSDMSISLKYYLDMFEELPEDSSLSEAGLLLLNSAIIYGKRIDIVHLAVKKLIWSLLNTESVGSGREELYTSLPPKSIQRGRKRSFEQLHGPYESELKTKRIKILSDNKRFDDLSSKSFIQRANSFIDYEVKSSIANLSKMCTHPATWKYSTIEDYDYIEDSDFKKNYKLFTYHLEHRYNTLKPDINFDSYFKMKDFIDANSEDCTNSKCWPPLSVAYIEHYVNVENLLLCNEGHDAVNQYITEEGSSDNTQIRNTDQNLSHKSDTRANLQTPECESCHGEVREDVRGVSQICLTGNSNFNIIRKDHLDTTLEVSFTTKTISTESSVEHHLVENQLLKNSTLADSKVIENELETPPRNGDDIPNKSGSNSDSMLLGSKCDEHDLTTIKVILPHLDDEGVFFSELDERDQQMLSPAVIATDVFSCVNDKSNIIVIVDDVIKQFYNIQEPKTQVLSLPVYSCLNNSLVSLNILKIHQKYLKRRRPFKLGSEFHLLKKERHKTNPVQTKHQAHPRSWVRLSDDVSGVPLSPPLLHNREPDFFGFAEETHNDKNRTLSRDSGISLHQMENMLDREMNYEFQESKSCLQMKLQSKGFEELLESELAGNREVENELADSKSKEKKSFGSEKSNSTITLKVQEWHHHLRPILAQSKCRHHFDVLDIGKEIVSQLKDMEKITLSNIMHSKENALISRYFLSALLLANQGNISININNKNSEIPSELKDIELTLLCKQQNNVSREDNINFRTTQTSVEERIHYSVAPNIRTLKTVPSNPKLEDHDSGISMSDGFSMPES